MLVVFLSFSNNFQPGNATYSHQEKLYTDFGGGVTQPPFLDSSLKIDFGTGIAFFDGVSPFIRKLTFWKWLNLVTRLVS